MQLTVLGSSGTYPTAGRPASGYLVTHEGTRLWMDAGPGTYGALCQEMDPRHLDAVLLTHRHPDHCTDIFALFHASAYGDREVGGLPLIVPDGLADHLCDFVPGSSDTMRKVFAFMPVGGGDTVDIATLQISIEMAAHPPPTIAPRIAAGGKTLTYTADTGPSPSLEEHASGSDLLLAEASLPGPRDAAALPHHMTGSEAGAMAARAGVRKLMLTHIPPYVDPDQAVADAESEFDGQVTLAVPGTRVTI